MRLLKRRFLPTALLLGTALIASGASVRENRGGLDAAKQQLEALDAAKSRELLGGSSSLPSASLPALDAAPPTPEPAPVIPRSRNLQLEKEQKSASKSKKWLIDAMEEKKASKARDDEKRQRDRAEESVPGDEELLAYHRALEDEAKEDNGKRTEERQTKAQLEAEVVNPLNGYMAAWMTPRDFQLLQAPRKDAATSSGSSAAMFAGADLENGLLGGSVGPSLNPDSRILPAMNAPSSNPYLSDPAIALASAALPEQTPAPPPLLRADLSSPTPATIAPLFESQPKSETLPARRAPLAESLRGSDDAKYFKQLKRF